ncbi:hypothetical protein CF327_g6197 [Tilletia walkeri]|nr:hypothetical protein CF327_g6197 [Tilletia walkeri]
MDEDGVEHECGRSLVEWDKRLEGTVSGSLALRVRPERAKAGSEWVNDVIYIAHISKRIEIEGKTQR